MSKRGSRTAAIYSEHSRPKPPKNKLQFKKDPLKEKAANLEKLFEQVWRTYYADNYIDEWWGKEFKKAFRFFKELGDKKRKDLGLTSKDLHKSLILKDSNGKSLLLILKTEYESILKQVRIQNSKEIDIVSIKEIISDDNLTHFENLQFNEQESGTNFPNDNVDTSLSEGLAKLVVLTKYERNTFARNACIAHYGYKCVVCDFDFEEFYGYLGKKFIHIHHLIPISSIAKEYIVDPINDLRPVCPNCHAMLHKSNPPLTILELKDIILNKRYLLKGLEK